MAKSMMFLGYTGSEVQWRRGCLTVLFKALPADFQLVLLAQVS